MFLIDSALASDDWNATLDNIKNLLTKYEADIETIKKWDSRRLAYSIKGKTHGTYILTYFRIDGTNIASIERDVQLSEKIMRVMILRTDRMSQEDLERQTPNDKIEQREKEIAEKAESAKSRPAVVPAESDSPATEDEVKETEEPQQETPADNTDAEETQLEKEIAESRESQTADVPETSDSPAAEDEVKETEEPQQEPAADETDSDETQLEMDAVEDVPDDMDENIQHNTHPPLEDDQEDSEEKTEEKTIE
jgi:ribosomal protein S6